MLFQIAGNVPGLQNAGVMWAEEFTAFLLGFGFTQSIADRLCHEHLGAMMGYVAISRRLSPGQLTEYAWDKLIQWARFLVNTKDLQLTMRKCPSRTNATFFTGSTSLNGPVPGSSYDGAFSSPRATRRWQKPS